MSTTEVTAEPRRKPAAEKKQVTVTLVRGTDYRLLFKGKSYLFEKGKSKEVPEDVADHLRENAQDTVTVEGGPELRPKFQYEV